MNRKQTSVESVCSLCHSDPVVLIEYSSSRRKQSHERGCGRQHQLTRKLPDPQPLCLLHFYTTDACRNVSTTTNSKSSSADKDSVQCIATVIDSMALQQQLPKQQELFAEAYLQIQQQIHDALQQQQQQTLPQQQQQQQQQQQSDQNIADDPLAIITDLNKGYNNTASRHRHAYDNLKSKSLRPKRKGQELDVPEGGFLREVPIPERIVQVQQQQIHQQQELIARMNRNSDSTDHDTTTVTSTTKTSGNDMTQRRKPTRTNVWNIISQDDRKQSATTKTSTYSTTNASKESNDTSITTTAANNKPTATTSIFDDDGNDDSVVCTCGSHRVEILSSNMNKNQDMTKAETWGNKDRQDEIIQRYSCHSCGKSWNDVT